MSKPRKTTAQLRSMIRREVAKTKMLSKRIVVSVWPDADSWKVVCHSPNPRQDKECFELIRTAAERLRTKFDLDL
jgi:hypothetical protein